MIKWIEHFEWHRFFILLVLSMVIIVSVKLLSKKIITIIPNCFPNRDSDLLMRMFGSSYPNKVRKKHVEGFLSSIGLYLFVDIAIFFDIVEKKDIGSPFISLLIIFLGLPALSMQISCKWVPIRRKSSVIIAVISILLTLIVLYFKKWL